MFIILALFAAFFVLTGNTNEKVRTYPYIVCGLGFILTAYKLGTTIYKEKKGISLDDSTPLTKEQFLSVIITLGAAFAYAFLASKIGYFTMTFVFVAAYSYWHTRTQKKWLYIVVALCINIVVYVAFKTFLHVPLPAGLLI